IPALLPLAKLASELVVVLGVPPEIWSTAPNSNAFMPSVATIGVTPIKLTSAPDSTPATSVIANASSIATASFPESPFGYWVAIRIGVTAESIRAESLAGRDSREGAGLSAPATSGEPTRVSSEAEPAGGGSFVSLGSLENICVRYAAGSFVTSCPGRVYFYYTV